MIYKVWIQIEEIDESKDHAVAAAYVNIVEPIEAGKFDTEAEAENYIVNELMHSRRRRPWGYIVAIVILLSILAWLFYEFLCLPKI